MTPAEFKAWFDGFTEAFTGCPTKAQWGRIKERVSEIDGKAVTERIYVDRYVDRYWPGRPYWQGLGAGTCNTYAQNTTLGSSLQNGLQGQNTQYQGRSCSSNAASNSFNGLSAMNALGRAEAGSLS